MCRRGGLNPFFVHKVLPYFVVTADLTIKITLIMCGEQPYLKGIILLAVQTGNKYPFFFTDAKKVTYQNAQNPHLPTCRLLNPPVTNHIPSPNPLFLGRPFSTSTFTLSRRTTISVRLAAAEVPAPASIHVLEVANKRSSNPPGCGR